MVKYIAQLIDEYVQQQPEELFPREPNVYWPSEAGLVARDGKYYGPCHRNLFYKYFQYPITDPTPLRTKMKRYIGKSLETMELQLLRDAKILIDEQVKFNLRIEDILTITGKVDGLCFIDGVYQGLELKTGAGYYFKQEVFGYKGSYGFPKLRNLFQVMIYIDTFKIHPSIPFNTCSLLYIDTETTEKKEFLIELQDGYPVIDGNIYANVNVADIYKNYMTIHSYISNKSLPPRSFNPYYTIHDMNKMLTQGKISKYKYNKWMSAGYGADDECAWCNWRQRCLKD